MSFAELAAQLRADLEPDEEGGVVLSVSYSVDTVKQIAAALERAERVEAAGVAFANAWDECSGFVSVDDDDMLSELAAAFRAALNDTAASV